MVPYSKHSTVESASILQGSEWGMRLRVVPDSFCKLFVGLNQQADITHFILNPGMLFNDTLQWWGPKNDHCREHHVDIPALRPRPHEGIDICLMQHFDKSLSSVLPQMLIPAILPGNLVHFHRDYLGETLYIQHPDIKKEGAVLHTLYGHTASVLCDHTSTAGNISREQFSANHSCPSSINKGQIVGTISSPPEACSVPAHLHISCAWIREEQQVEELNWENMATNNNVFFIDPLPFLV